MTDSPELVVRRFLSILEDNSQVEAIIRFFCDDAVYVDGPRAVHHGIDAIKSELL